MCRTNLCDSSTGRGTVVLNSRHGGGDVARKAAVARLGMGSVRGFGQLENIFGRDRRAVTALEYALIAGIIAVVLVVSVLKIGPELNITFNSVSSEL
jgi:pilus assembly protein Flp/PilA